MKTKIKVGDRIRILQDRYLFADVKAGDVLTVLRCEGEFVDTNRIGQDGVWGFTQGCLGTGFEIVQSKDSEPKKKSERLTRRERFAVAMLNGMLSHQLTISAYRNRETRPQDMAKRAVEYADALIAELDKK